MKTTFSKEHTAQGRVLFVYKNNLGDWAYLAQNVCMMAATSIERIQEYKQQLDDYYTAFNPPLQSPTDTQEMMAMLYLFTMREAAKATGCDFEMRAEHIVSLLGDGDYVFDFSSRTGTYSAVHADEFDALLKKTPQKIRRRKTYLAPAKQSA